MQGCQATGKSSKSQAGRARTVVRGTPCPQGRPVDQPPHPEGSHTTVVPFYPAPLLTSLVFLSTPPWPDTPPLGGDRRFQRRRQARSGRDRHHLVLAEVHGPLRRHLLLPGRQR